MPYVEIEGQKFYYSGHKRKDGLPLLFCHGSGGGHHHWLYQLKNLPPFINPLSVDLPGHGRSEGKAREDIGLYRDWLRRFVKALGLEQFLLGGHSMGGALALAYALQYPEEVRGLILVGTGARLRVRPSFLEELSRGSVPEAMLESLYDPDAPGELVKRGRREIENSDPSVYLADLKACDSFDIMECLHRIKAPTLIICGSEDRMTPVKYSRFLDQNIPRSRLEIIDKAGHMVMLEQPEAVNRAIAQFVEEDLL